ncbi:hypothetical protein [Streptomyces bottropensis]|uniref:Transposase n=1 Tax=Streptomyces bottropensis TaxID=42235 RepID=A0ABU8B1D1_9ACTN
MRHRWSAKHKRHRRRQLQAEMTVRFAIWEHITGVAGLATAV